MQLGALLNGWSWSLDTNVPNKLVLFAAKGVLY